MNSPEMNSKENPTELAMDDQISKLSKKRHKQKTPFKKERHATTPEEKEILYRSLEKYLRLPNRTTARQSMERAVAKELQQLSGGNESNWDFKKVRNWFNNNNPEKKGKSLNSNVDQNTNSSPNYPAGNNFPHIDQFNSPNEQTEPNNQNQNTLTVSNFQHDDTNSEINKSHDALTPQNFYEKFSNSSSDRSYTSDIYSDSRSSDTSFSSFLQRSSFRGSSLFEVQAPFLQAANQSDSTKANQVEQSSESNVSHQTVENSVQKGSTYLKPVEPLISLPSQANKNVQNRNFPLPIQLSQNVQIPEKPLQNEKENNVTQKSNDVSNLPNDDSTKAEQSENQTYNNLGQPFFLPLLMGPNVRRPLNIPFSLNSNTNLSLNSSQRESNQNTTQNLSMPIIEKTNSNPVLSPPFNPELVQQSNFNSPSNINVLLNNSNSHPLHTSNSIDAISRPVDHRAVAIPSLLNTVEGGNSPKRTTSIPRPYNELKDLPQLPNLSSGPPLPSLMARNSNLQTPFLNQSNQQFPLPKQLNQQTPMPEKLVLPMIIPGKSNSAMPIPNISISAVSLPEQSHEFVQSQNQSNQSAPIQDISIPMNELREQSNESVQFQEQSTESVKLQDKSNESVQLPEQSNELVQLQEQSKESVQFPEQSNELVQLQEQSKESVQLPEQSNELVQLQEQSNESVQFPEQTNESVQLQEQSNESIQLQEQSNKSIQLQEQSNESVQFPEQSNESIQFPEQSNESVQLQEQSHQSITIEDQSLPEVSFPEQILLDESSEESAELIESTTQFTQIPEPSVRPQQRPPEELTTPTDMPHTPVSNPAKEEIPDSSDPSRPHVNRKHSKHRGSLHETGKRRKRLKKSSNIASSPKIGIQQININKSNIPQQLPIPEVHKLVTPQIEIPPPNKMPIPNIALRSVSLRNIPAPSQDTSQPPLPQDISQPLPPQDISQPLPPQNKTTPLPPQNTSRLLPPQYNPRAPPPPQFNPRAPPPPQYSARPSQPIAVPNNNQSGSIPPPILSPPTTFQYDIQLNRNNRDPREVNAENEGELENGDDDDAEPILKLPRVPLDFERELLMKLKHETTRRLIQILQVVNNQWSNIYRQYNNMTPQKITISKQDIKSFSVCAEQRMQEFVVYYRFKFPKDPLSYKTGVPRLELQLTSPSFTNENYPPQLLEGLNEAQRKLKMMTEPVFIINEEDLNRSHVQRDILSSADPAVHQFYQGHVFQSFTLDLRCRIGTSLFLEQGDFIYSSYSENLNMSILHFRGNLLPVPFERSRQISLLQPLVRKENQIIVSEGTSLKIIDLVLSQEVWSMQIPSFFQGNSKMFIGTLPSSSDLILCKNDTVHIFSPKANSFRSIELGLHKVSAFVFFDLTFYLSRLRNTDKRQFTFVAVSSSETPTIHIYDAITFEVVARLVGHTSGVTSLYFSKGRFLVSGGVDGTVRIWEINLSKEDETGKEYVLIHRCRCLNIIHSASIVGVCYGWIDKEDFLITADSNLIRVTNMYVSKPYLAFSICIPSGYAVTNLNMNWKTIELSFVVKNTKYQENDLPDKVFTYAFAKRTANEPITIPMSNNNFANPNPTNRPQGSRSIQPIEIVSLANTSNGNST